MADRPGVWVFIRDGRLLGVYKNRDAIVSDAPDAIKAHGDYLDGHDIEWQHWRDDYSMFEVEDDHGFPVWYEAELYEIQ